jgi:hypothetical protein
MQSGFLFGYAQVAGKYSWAPQILSSLFIRHVSLLPRTPGAPSAKVPFQTVSS